MIFTSELHHTARASMSGPCVCIPPTSEEPRWPTDVLSQVGPSINLGQVVLEFCSARIHSESDNPFLVSEKHEPRKWPLWAFLRAIPAGTLYAYMLI